MIIKEKSLENLPSSPMLKAGVRQEQDVAFYLRRTFKNRDDVMVFNDLRLVHDGEVAQIDHLVVTALGFCLIESKSIKAEVSINQQGEWSRKYKGMVKGMKSPIKQVELQQELLKSLLRDHAPDIIGKLLGLLQQGFGGRKWAAVCAISNDAVISRKYLPKALGERVMKSEFIAEWVDKNMTHGVGVTSKLKKIKNSSPSFSVDELKAISDFLLGRDQPLKSIEESPQAVPVTTADVPKPEAVVSVPVSIQAPLVPPVINEKKPALLKCKACLNPSQLTGSFGKFGYYVRCECGTNTTMKRKCERCGSQMKIKKAKTEYSASCACGSEYLVYSAKTEAQAGCP